VRLLFWLLLNLIFDEALVTSTAKPSHIVVTRRITITPPPSIERVTFTSYASGAVSTQRWPAAHTTTIFSTVISRSTGKLIEGA
jgi:hypothetical protein